MPKRNNNMFGDLETGHIPAHIWTSTKLDGLYLLVALSFKRFRVCQSLWRMVQGG